ncbi:hypothetical protein LTR17_000383 [Elasticomyces elasticus]|nr:hypothetical protein LTR17_000383 [Elasticomyces elasticus]
MATLETLPVETLIHVALELDRKSLHAFRFVCRNIASAVKDAYLRMFYEGTYLATPYGMQKLVDDTERNDYARYLKCITLVAPGIAPDNSRGASSSAITNLAHDTEDAEAKDLIRKCFDETQTTAARSGMIASLLTVALCNLRINGYSPIIHVTDLIRSPTVVTGLKALVREAYWWSTKSLRVQPTDLGHWSIHEILPVALTAIATSRFEIGILNITASKGLAENALAGTEMLFNPAKKPLQALKCLNMSLGPNESTQPHFNFEGLADILESTPNLQHMTLSLEPCGINRSLKSKQLLGCFSLYSSAALHSLTLEHIHQVSMYDLLEASDAWPEQLKSLHLVNISITANDRFSKMFVEILDNFELQELRLHDLKDTDGWLLGFRGSVADIWIKDVKTEGHLPMTARNYQVLLLEELPVLLPGHRQGGAGSVKLTLLELIEYEEYHIVDEAGIVVQTTKMYAQGEDED